MKKKWNIDDDFTYLENADGTSQKYTGEPYRSIWLEKFKKTPYCYGLLAHEATHCAMRICEDKGIPISTYRNEDEVLAYMVDFLITDIVRQYKK